MPAASITERQSLASERPLSANSAGADPPLLMPSCWYLAFTACSLSIAAASYRDQIPNRLPGRGVRDREDVRIGADQGNRRQIGFRIVIDRLDHQAVKRNCAADPNHRVAVRDSMSSHVDSEMAAG